MLSTIGVASPHQSNHLHTKNIRARLNTVRDFEIIFVVIVDELVGRPVSSVIIGFSGTNLTSRFDKLEFQIGLIDRKTITVCARSQVSEGWAKMTRGPRCPAKVDNLSSFNLHVLRGVGCIDVANDVPGAIGIGRDESNFGNPWVPPATCGISSLFSGVGVIKRKSTGQSANEHAC